jgi:hypothetical protein
MGQFETHSYEGYMGWGLVLIRWYRHRYTGLWMYDFVKELQPWTSAQC